MGLKSEHYDKSSSGSQVQDSLQRIIEHSISVPRRVNQMILDENQENKYTIKQETHRRNLSKVKLWCQFPSGKLGLGKKMWLGNRALKKSRKSLSTYLEAKERVRDKVDHSAFYLCAFRAL